VGLVMPGASCTTTTRDQDGSPTGTARWTGIGPLGRSICTVDTSPSSANELLRPAWVRHRDGEESDVDREPEHEMGVPEQDEQHRRQQTGCDGEHQAGSRQPRDAPHRQSKERKAATVAAIRLSPSGRRAASGTSQDWSRENSGTSETR